MSLTWPSILQAVESSEEIVCESSEDVTKPPEIREWHRFTKYAWVMGTGSDGYGYGYGFAYL